MKVIDDKPCRGREDLSDTKLGVGECRHTLPKYIDNALIEIYHLKSIRSLSISQPYFNILLLLSDVVLYHPNQLP
jgi:hypothetical protein